MAVIDWFPGEVRFGNELLLRVGDFLDRHLHTEIAARDHDTIRCCENFVEMRKRIGALDLRNDERLAANFCRCGAHSLDVRGAFNERLAHRVNALFKRKLKARRGRVR